MTWNLGGCKAGRTTWLRSPDLFPDRMMPRRSWRTSILLFQSVKLPVRLSCLNCATKGQLGVRRIRSMLNYATLNPSQRHGRIDAKANGSSRTRPAKRCNGRVTGNPDRRGLGFGRGSNVRIAEHSARIDEMSGFPARTANSDRVSTHTRLRYPGCGAGAERHWDRGPSTRPSSQCAGSQSGQSPARLCPLLSRLGKRFCSNR